METTYDVERPYKGKELLAVLRAMNARQLRNTLKSAYRKEVKKVREIVRTKASSSGLAHGASVGRSVRGRVYPRGGGFMVTARPRGNRYVAGSVARGYHKNRFGLWKPVALWASSGTDGRYTKDSAKRAVNLGGTGNPVLRSVGPKRGRMPSYGFMDAAESPSVALVERDMGKEILDAVNRRLEREGIVTG